MTTGLKRDLASASLAILAPGSPLGRRLVLRSRDNSVRRRILTWSAAIDDALLLKFGLTFREIVIVPSIARGQRN